MKRIFLLSLSLLAFSCGQSEFAGDVDKAAAKKPATTPIKEGPTPAPTTPAKPGDKPQVSEQPTTEVEETPPSTTPEVPNVVDTTPPAKPQTSIFDIIGGLIKILSEVEIARPNDNEVVFGGDKVFHIGDANFSVDSECAAQIRAYPLKGTRYFFEFEVLQDDTKVDVTLNKICGIDYNESNIMHLQADGKDLEQKGLKKGDTTAAFTQKTLKKGKYSILVESKAAGAQNPQTPNDHDDYILGMVQIKGDKPLKPGKVGARP